jgi:endogenous inhibitor of DNA gyrase (YacG/DUF329 family)
MLSSVLGHMLDHECPHCQKRAISTWRAVRIPMRELPRITCSECGTEVEATIWSVFWTNIPFVAAFALAWCFVNSTLIFWMIVGGTLAGSMWLSRRFVVWFEKS